MALGLVSCGADGLEPAVLAELCGADAPFRLVALEPDERLLSGFERIGDRYYYTVGRKQSSGNKSWYVDHALWSVGPCGESPSQIARGVSSIFMDLERWPGVLLGCSSDEYELVGFDLAGAEPHRALVTDISCFAEATDHGFLHVEGADDEPASLILYPYPVELGTDAPEPRVLLSPTFSPQYPITGDMHAHLSVGKDTASVLTTDGRIVTIGLADGASTVEQTDVRNFYISPEGRYLLYQGATLIPDDPYRPAGVLFLRDRTTGEGASLVQSWLSYGEDSLGFTTRGVVTLKLGTGLVRVYFLPGLDFVDLPDYLGLLRQVDDGRWLMHAWSGCGPIYLGDLHDLASATPLFGDAVIVPTFTRSDGITVVTANDCHPYSYDAEGALWFVPFDGSAPSRLADRGSKNTVQLDDERLATSVNIDDDGLADVVLVDLETGVEALVDRRVYAPIAPHVPLERLDGDIYHYSVVDGERSGVWLVRLPVKP